jgi:hypothetical protein
MSLRAAAFAFWRRSTRSVRIGEGIASGEKQECPRNDIVSLVGEGTYIFINPYALNCDSLSVSDTCAVRQCGEGLLDNCRGFSLRSERHFVR